MCVTVRENKNNNNSLTKKIKRKEIYLLITKNIQNKFKTNRTFDFVKEYMYACMCIYLYVLYINIIYFEYVLY